MTVAPGTTASLRTCFVPGGFKAWPRPHGHGRAAWARGWRGRRTRKPGGYTAWHCPPGQGEERREKQGASLGAGGAGGSAGGRDLPGLHWELANTAKALRASR